jgi:hypothetical protein
MRGWRHEAEIGMGNCCVSYGRPRDARGAASRVERTAFRRPVQSDVQIYAGSSVGACACHRRWVRGFKLPVRVWRLAEGDHQEYFDITITELHAAPKRSRGNVLTAVPTVFASDQPMTAARAEAAPPPRRPYVVVHVAVSIDGHTTGFNVDLARFYSLLPTWQEDITLTGADTILAQERELAAAPRPGPAERAAPLGGGRQL